MAFTFNNYATGELMKSPLNDIIENILGGYEHAVKASYLQPSLSEQLRQSQLGNEKSQLENKWYEPNMQSQIGLRGAQAGHLGAMTQGENIRNKYLPQQLKNDLIAAQFKAQNPLLSMTGNAGQIGALLYLQQHPELGQMATQGMNQKDSQVSQGMDSYIPSIVANQQQAQQGNELSNMNPRQLMLDSIMNNLRPKEKQYAPSNLGKLQQEYADIQAGYYPNSGRKIPFESEQSQEEVAAPYREKLGGLKQGEHYVYDPETHEKIGVQRPYTPKERETETGRAFFNEVFPTINSGFKDFIGKGSVENFIKYANNYGKNDIATKKIDDLLLAQNLISAGIVNEAATLGAGKTNMTYRNLAKSFPKSDIPALIQRYGNELKLPGEAFAKAGIRFNHMINKAQQSATGSVPALKTQYYRPEKYLKTNEEKSYEKEASHKMEIPHYTDADIKETARKYGMTEKEVREKLKKAKKNG